MTPSVLAVTAVVIAAMAVLTSSLHSQPFRAAAITRAGHLAFDAPIDTVFSLFTPQGERHWARGWDPQILYPLDRDVAEGMVFTTRDEDATSVWTIARYDAANHAILYTVVVADRLVRRIEVRCRAAAPAKTAVDVTDSYVALSPGGTQFIEQLTETAYAAKMTSWVEAIGGYLRGGAKEDRDAAR